MRARLNPTALTPLDKLSENRVPSPSYPMTDRIQSLPWRIAHSQGLENSIEANWVSGPEPGW